jgi:hypothetical protein
MDYQVVNVLANGLRGGTQNNDNKLDLLGRFAAEGNIRTLLGTKLHINQQTGDFSIQDSGLKTWWARSAADSLTNPAVHGHVTRLFENAKAEVRRIGDTDRCVEKVKRIHYAFKGYSTLIRRGSSGSDLLKNHVRTIAGICSETFRVPYVHQISQGALLPRGHSGVCWGFVLDWLRRSFNGKFSYENAKIEKKMGAIASLHRDQMDIKVAALFGGARLVNPNNPRVNQGAYEGGYVSRAGHGAQRFNQRFDGMTYHGGDMWDSTFWVAPEEQRCYGVRAPDDASFPRLVGEKVMNYVRLDRYKNILGPDADCGWLLSLSFRDFFTNAQSTGHAIGIRFTPDRRSLLFFDPNFGTGDIFLGMGHLWVDSVIKQYSFGDVVERVSVTRVSST